MKVRVRPFADRDIDAHVAYLAREAGDAVALRFLDGLERAVEELRVRPEAGSPRALDDPRLAGLRSWPVQGFRKVRLFYLVRRDAIEIVRVLHGARDVPPLLAER